MHPTVNSLTFLECVSLRISYVAVTNTPHLIVLKLQSQVSPLCHKYCVSWPGVCCALSSLRDTGSWSRTLSLEHWMLPWQLKKNLANCPWALQASTHFFPASHSSKVAGRVIMPCTYGRRELEVFGMQYYFLLSFLFYPNSYTFNCCCYC